MECIACGDLAKPAQQSTRAVAAWLFRKQKANDLGTEALMQPDTDLVFEMHSRKLRVQDILDYMSSLRSISMPREDMENFLTWYSRRR